MRRYLRLYAFFLRFSFSRAMEFRVDFFFRVVMDMVFYGTQLALFSILYQHTSTIAGWDFSQSLIFISGFFFVDALHMTVFANNMWMLPILINRGDVDYYLVRPISSLFFLGMRDFAANSFLNLVIATGILWWAIARYPSELEPARIGVFVLLLVCGCFLYWTIYMLFLIPVFWIHQEQGLRQLFWGLEKFSERPDRIFTGWLHRVLVTCLPFAIITSYPAHVLFEGITASRLAHIGGVIIGMFLLMLWFWKRGLRAYSSASS